MAQPVEKLPAPVPVPMPEKAASMLAVRLLQTKPRTSEHCNQWRAFRLGVVLLAEVQTADQEMPPTAAHFNTTYLSYLSSTAGFMKQHSQLHVLIPPLDWSMERWDSDVERTYDALVAPEGIVPREMSENALLECMASGTVRVNDRRAWDARYLARTAFRIVGQ